MTTATTRDDAAATEQDAASTPPDFAQLGVDGRIVEALAADGITHPFAIQSLTLPLALAGNDLIGQARTGMGKTLAFGAPMLHRLAQADDDAATGSRAPRALIIVPTRELCVQVCRDLQSAGRHLPLVITSVYGGRAYEPQIKALSDGVDIVVGTPGRLLDLANQGHLVLGAVQVLVLDEADEMLDLGFLPDIERVLTMVPSRRQTMLFSATMPDPIITLARSFMVQPTHIRAESPLESATHRTTTQFVYRAHAMNKVEMLSRILQARSRGLSMVFTRTKRTAAKVADELGRRGFAAAAVHGDLGQGAREQALRAFRSGKVGVLVATDVAARGIDVDGVTHVINYQCPEDESTYIHRIGRTGRAGQSGVAITFVDWDDVPRWKLINQELGLDFDEPVETYSSSAHLFTDLDIPTDATGVLPVDQRTREGLKAERVEDLGETGRKNRAPRSGDHGRSRQGSRSGSGRSGGHRGSAADATAAPAATPAADSAAAGEGGQRRRRRRRRTRGGARPAAGD